MTTKRLLLLTLTALLVASGQAQERTGTVSQPLVGGRVPSPDQQELLTLLTLLSPAGSCSASLLTNDWAITAAHCVESDGATLAAGAIRLSAQWGTVQTRPATRVVTFRPRDVAIIQVATPFSVNGSTSSVEREISAPMSSPTGDPSAACRSRCTAAASASSHTAPAEAPRPRAQTASFASASSASQT